MDDNRPRRRVLNVGGSNKDLPLPKYFAGWDHVLLDIDDRPGVDIVADARSLATLTPGQFDAVYCAHTLEHFFFHDVPKVLSGFRHVLRSEGFVEIRVPDLDALMKIVAARNLDIDDAVYDSPAGPIRVRDVIYGFGPEIEASGQDFYAHKSGFSSRSLVRRLQENGFPFVNVRTGRLEIRAIGLPNRPDDATLKLPGIPGT